MGARLVHHFVTCGSLESTAKSPEIFQTCCIRASLAYGRCLHMASFQVLNPSSQPCDFRAEVLSRSEAFENNPELLNTWASSNSPTVIRILHVNDVNVCTEFHQRANFYNDSPMKKETGELNAISNTTKWRATACSGD